MSKIVKFSGLKPEQHTMYKSTGKMSGRVKGWLYRVNPGDEIPAEEIRPDHLEAHLKHKRCVYTQEGPAPSGKK